MKKMRDAGFSWKRSGNAWSGPPFRTLVHVWLMFDSKNGIPARVRLDYVSVWFKNFVRVNTHKQTEKQSINKNQCNLGSRMIKFKNAGLWAPHKISLGSRLHSQKRIRAPVSKMIGLRAPKQKFQGSRAPGTPPPPLRPWVWKLFRASVKKVKSVPDFSWPWLCVLATKMRILRSNNLLARRG